MEEHDEQFEMFLRQFKLRTPGPLAATASFHRRSAVRRGVAAAVAVFVIVVSTVAVRHSHTGGNPHATVEVAGSPSLYTVGERIEAGAAVRSNSAEGLTLTLSDGSHVEMRSQSELYLEPADDGIRVRLNVGSILVTASKQGAGHLYVQTRDAVVSVVGTVFFVNAELSGTRVAVVEGEVHVQQGSTLKKLLPGEQLATNPSIQLRTLAEDIAWSRNAGEYLALLPQQDAEVVPLRSNPASPAQAGGAPEIKNDDPVVPAVKGVPAGLPFKVQAHYIKSAAEEIRTLITIQILNRDLAFQEEVGEVRAKAHITGVIFRADNRRIPGFSYDLDVPFASKKSLNDSLDQPQLFQETEYLAPGKYKLHLSVEDKNSENVGYIDYALNVPRILEHSLQASSMILAYSITDVPPRTVGTEQFVLGDKKVKPNVTGVFRRDQNLSVWQAFYGLTMDQATHKPSATFELVISQNEHEIKTFNTSSTELVESGQQMNYTNTLPLADFAPGPYEVQVKVTDNLVKESLVTKSKFSVVASPARQEQAPAQPQQPTPSRVNPGRMIFDRACSTCHRADVVARFNYATKSEYANLVSREQSIGASISDEEFSPLVDYLFETFGKKTEAPIPSDVPLQRVQPLVK